MLAGDEKLIEDFNSDMLIFTQKRRRKHIEISIDEVSNQRRAAKVINFGVLTE